MERESFIKSKIEIVSLDENDIIATSPMGPGIELPEEEW